MRHLSRLFILFFALHFFASAEATNYDYPFSARFAGMGNASVMMYDFWAISNNQAGLAKLSFITAGMHFENAYFVKELSLKAGAVAIPTKTGVFGVSVSNFGYSEYGETQFSLAYAKSLGEIFSIGLQLNYLNIHIGEEYGSKGAPTVAFGLIAEPIKNLQIGAHVLNPTQAKIADYEDERLPTIIRVGAGYRFSEKLIVNIETEKDLEYAPVFKAGAEYHIIKPLVLRIGISTNPTLNTFGLGLIIKNLRADFAFTQHPTLGYSPHFSLSYAF